MKKLLIVLSSFTLVSGASLSVVSCKKGENQAYNQFRDALNHTQGSYDEFGNPLKQSGSTVIYIGAKNNASSQSFEATVKHTFGNDLRDANRYLSRPWETVNISDPFQFEAVAASLSSYPATIISGIPITGIENPVGTFIQITLDGMKFDGTLVQKTDGNVSVKILGIQTEQDYQILKAAFERAQSADNRVYSSIKLYELDNKISFLSNQDELYQQWVASYQTTWMQQRNADRGVFDVKMQLRSGSNYYGAILEQPLTTPTYGIKGQGRLGIYAPITIGLDYVKPELTFQNYSFDDVNNYWSNDFFNKLTSFLREDILYQLGANNPIEDGNEATEKNAKAIKQRVETADSILSKIKQAKGPLFLFVKNGHFVDARRGWNRYYRFGGRPDLDEATYYSDLLSWAKELGSVWSQSAQSHLDTILSDGVQLWNSVVADDDGAANWDWQNGKEIEQK